MRMKLTAALIGALIVIGSGAGAAQPTAQRPQGPTKVEVVNTVQTSEVNSSWEPTPLEKECAQGSEDRQSDLCAQWKAADSAGISAIWTRVSGFASILSAILGGVTLYFLIQTFNETRKTAEQAELANKLTHSPKFHFGEVVLPLTIGVPLSGKLLSMNIGQVAVDIQHMHLGVFIGGEHLPQENPINTMPEVFPNELNKDIQWWSFTGPVLDNFDFADISTGNKILYVIGRAIYEAEAIPKPRQRHAKFCFRYDYKTKRFGLVDDPDYVHGG